MTTTNENILVVDSNDHIIGEAEKIYVHQNGILHRAFSVFIFRYHKGKLQVLLQQRNKNKYHSGGLWSNTCCSHLHKGEDMTEAAQQCLKNEMGIDATLKYVGKFHYTVKFANGLTENEIDHVFVGRFDDDRIYFNKDEVESFQWKDVFLVQTDVSINPEKYTFWFKQALDLSLREVE